MMNEPTVFDEDSSAEQLYLAVENQLTTMTDAARDAMLLRTKHFMGTVVDFKDMMMMYSCAIKEIETKFDILNTEFKARYCRNPISSISTRLKSTKSITDKLSHLHLPFTLQNIEEHIHDIAGVRVICAYIDDIYLIADALLKQDDITLLQKKDYIAHPKDNGYRSLHLIVKVPVFFADQKKDMKVEVQIRTIAMDFWASLEHQMKYKQEIPAQDTIIEELRACAEVISETDEKMLQIRKKIEAAADIPTEDDILIERISRLDVTF